MEFFLIKDNVADVESDSVVFSVMRGRGFQLPLEKSIASSKDSFQTK